MKAHLVLGLALGLAAGAVPPAFAEQASCPLVYLPVRETLPSSYDETPDWAPPQDPRAPVDGNFETRWASRPGVDNEWISFDLGRPKTLSRIVLHWERAYAVDYDLLVSNDAESWTLIAAQRDRRGGVEEIAVPDTTARYVKLVGLKRFHPDWGISLWEFEAYGCQASNPEDQPIEAVFPGRKPRGAVQLTMEPPLPPPGPAAPGVFQRGMVFLSFHENQLVTPESDAMLEELAKLHVTDIALVVTWYQDTVDSDAVYPESPEGGRTPVDEALAHAINRMHALGMRVMLKPHIDVQTGEFRAEIAGSEAWFESYRAFIRHYAELAARYHAELLCVGTELAGTSYRKWEPKWRQVIQDVRAVYPGPLVYGANWDEYEGVPFWDAVDIIGIDAYFPLTEITDPTHDELVAAWERRAGEIERWRMARGLTQPVVFSEIGYGSADGVNRTPWEISSKQEDQVEQADCLEAMLTVMTRRDWFRGMYWWNWFAQPIESPLGFPIRGKRAAGVLARWYGAIEREAPLSAPASSRRAAAADGGTLFGFEQDAQGWGIPDWALEKPDMVGREVLVAPEGATEGKKALALVVDFPGGKWNGALAEVEEYFDWTPYQTLAVDVTLPPEAPAGLKAKLILTVGEEWTWTEMRRSVQLTPGETTTLHASLAPGSEDWKRTVVDDTFRKDVRKLAVRLESNKPAYQGTCYLDNVRVE